MATLKLTGSKDYYTHMYMQYTTNKNYISLSRELKKKLSNESCKNGVIYQGKYTKQSIKWK